jgi:hypothetical protein
VNAYEKSAAIRQDPPESVFPFLVNQLSKIDRLSWLGAGATPRSKVVTVCNFATVSEKEALPNCALADASDFSHFSNTFSS